MGQLDGLVELFRKAGAPEGIAALLAFLTVVAATVVVGPIVTSSVQNIYEKRRQKQRKLRLLEVLRSQFGHLARHSATNLRRLTEVFRDPPSVRELGIIVRKISINAPTDDAERRVASTSISDLSLLPEHLARDVLRIQLIARNAEMDVKTTVKALATEDQFARYDPIHMPWSAQRMSMLARTVERCATDSARIMERLRHYEEQLRPLTRLFRSAGRYLSQKGVLYADQPMHFEDATDLREVSDWRNWKEEQLLLSAKEVSDVVAASLPGVASPAEVTVLRQRLDTINLISECKTPHAHICVRTRVNQEIFQYEQGLIKEAVVALAMQATPSDTGHFDEAVSDIVRRLETERLSPEQYPITFPIGADVLFLDPKADVGKGRLLPLVISRWIAGGHMQQSPTKSVYSQLGNAVAQLHRVRFGKFYRNLRDLGQYKFARDFRAAVVNEIRAKNEDAALVSPALLDRAVVMMDPALEQAENEGFVLCHNDLHANNVIVTGGSDSRDVVILDWDNACIHHRYLDFVKMKYWCKVGETSKRFVEDADLFAAFCLGYGEKRENVEASRIFAILSLLWLFRVHAFETKRKASGKSIDLPFLEPAHYEREIHALVRQISRWKGTRVRATL